ncbi:hypothetical protein CRG98_000570 [Punica granatum]|uniref:Uncharacterized protein n=1 Tax=Punica granatum TaxID=22663 RepID=A0A2I0LEC1_PUNGR|nr:hypothetical protein CRG98_000570 [Punica granatum]
MPATSSTRGPNQQCRWSLAWWLPLEPWDCYVLWPSYGVSSGLKLAWLLEFKDVIAGVNSEVVRQLTAGWENVARLRPPAASICNVLIRNWQRETRSPGEQELGGYRDRLENRAEVDLSKSAKIPRVDDSGNDYWKMSDGILQTLSSTCERAQA